MPTPVADTKGRTETDESRGAAVARVASAATIDELIRRWRQLGVDFPIVAAAAQIGITAVAIIVFRHLVPQGPFAQSGSGYGAWDGVHYLAIAQYGYQVDGDTAFFPLYPLLVHAAHTVTRLSYVRSGMLVSDVAAAAAFVVLHRLIVRSLGRQVADRSILLLLAFPFALFLNVVYTESLTLLLVALFFLFLQQNRWWWAMAAGAFASATHDLGVLLVLPALWYWWFHGRSPVRLFSIALIAGGLVAYAAYLLVRFHDPLEFSAAQKYWGRQAVVPVWTILRSLAHINFHAPDPTTWNLNMVSFLNGTITLGVIGLACWGLLAPRLPGEQMVYLTTTLLASIATGLTKGAPAVYWTTSYGRSMLVLFPAFIILGSLLTRRSVFVAVVVSMLTLRVLLTGMFADGFWVT